MTHVGALPLGAQPRRVLYSDLMIRNSLIPGEAKFGTANALLRTTNKSESFDFMHPQDDPAS